MNACPPTDNRHADRWLSCRLSRAFSSQLSVCTLTLGEFIRIARFVLNVFLGKMYHSNELKRGAFTKIKLHQEWSGMEPQRTPACFVWSTSFCSVVIKHSENETRYSNELAFCNENSKILLQSKDLRWLVTSRALPINPRIHICTTKVGKRQSHQVKIALDQ